MNTTYLLLLLGAAAIILPLAWYAWRLTRQVKDADNARREAEAEAELQLRNHQQELIKDIRFISLSVIQKQCEITEGVLRLQYLLKGLDPDVWEQPELASLRTHYDAVKEMPILEAYKALTPKQQFELDKTRLTLEETHQASIERELRWLHQYSFPQVTLLQ